MITMRNRLQFWPNSSPIIMLFTTRIWTTSAPVTKQVCLSISHPKTPGLSTHYSEWAGKSRIVIPVSAGKSIGETETEAELDTSLISQPDVVEEMQKEEDKALDTRKEMVEIREDEIDKKQEIIDQEQEVLTEEKETVEEAITEKEKEMETVEQGSREEEVIKEEIEVLEEKEKEIQEKQDVLKEEQKELDKEQDEVIEMREEIAKR